MPSAGCSLILNAWPAWHLCELHSIWCSRSTYMDILPKVSLNNLHRECSKNSAINIWTKHNTIILLNNNKLYDSVLYLLWLFTTFSKEDILLGVSNLHVPSLSFIPITIIDRERAQTTVSTYFLLKRLSSYVGQSRPIVQTLCLGLWWHTSQKHPWQSIVTNSQA